MIIGIAIAVAYVAVGLVVGRQCALRRRRLGLWGDGPYGDGTTPGEDDLTACALAFIFWPFALASFWFARPPKLARAERLKAELEKLEREMGIGG